MILFWMIVTVLIYLIFTLPALFDVLRLTLAGELFPVEWAVWVIGLTAALACGYFWGLVLAAFGGAA